jgi:hypothetical protein
MRILTIQAQNRLSAWRVTASAALALAWIASVCGGCGYSLQRSKSEWLEKEGIRRVYVRPLDNTTFKPGVENTVYNALIRTLLSHQRVKVVSDEESADAILSGNITSAQFSVAGSTLASDLSPKFGSTLPFSGIKLNEIPIATIYSANLSCGFSLTRREPARDKSSVIWASSFSRSKPFQAANQLDVPGATSALINESAFERALSEMATSMMDDLHESMLAMF